ncbi:hypothetical protein SEA_MUFASA_83 [Mycobacterium phage Mufasa]|uniref:Uncharacterized protein n=2 Tax=Timquatrovirus TaxID=1623306 RepID=A0A0M4R2D0_9CAUD|nr:hypothetical protein PBI_ZOEJ_83 [Mycobacterium phage ZoeJ]YP_009195329.1 hypothetical protein SEA_MUFASA_83 [Mycobacterium phage Mufasa]AHY26907.1 hypothetical protein PBI_ZOEJ_83 [Mycobacterium phage ZoeJ]ALF00517.1 hypothetical protein SEA_MUFASA_83 [Mycobacterium phage Mufasa]
MNVAEQYPARTDTNGRTWFRPVRPPGADVSQWGWTSQPEQAHPDYALAEVRSLPGGGLAVLPLAAPIYEPVGELGPEWVDVGAVEC